MGLGLWVRGAGGVQHGDAKVSDKLSSVYQRQQQMGYPGIVEESLDDLDEFALGDGHRGPIQVG